MSTKLHYYLRTSSSETVIHFDQSSVTVVNSYKMHIAKAVHSHANGNEKYGDNYCYC